MELAKFKICPECGKHNVPSRMECRYCEADLTAVKVVDQTAEQAEPESQPEAQPGSAAPALVRLCECGAENAPQARKCAVCGEDISDIVPTEKKAAAPFSYELRSVDGSFSVVIEKPLCVIGREAELSGFLADRYYVSREHARLTVTDGQLYLENLSRTNGTFLNNEPLPSDQPAAVGNGDEIGLGGKVIDGSRQERAAYLTVQICT